MGLINKLRNFMYGRHGFDSLSYALFIFYIVVSLVNAFVGNKFVTLFTFVIATLIVLRALSKNTEKRCHENEVYLRIWNKVKPPVVRFFHRIRDIKTHRYRKCKFCKAVLRVPRKKGKHNVRCPHCGKNVLVKIII